MFWSTEKFPWMPLLFNGDNSFMFSLALVKFTSLTCVILRINSVAFITLSEKKLPLWFAVSKSDGSPPSHPPLELKTCEWNSLLMSNKPLLSIVLRAFCVVVEWIIAVENCFSQKENFPATNDLLILYFLSFYCFSVLISDIRYFFVVSYTAQEAFFFQKGANVDAEKWETDNKSFSLVNNWDHW